MIGGSSSEVVRLIRLLSLSRTAMAKRHKLEEVVWKLR
jgi:hypothetical protein